MDGPNPFGERGRSLDVTALSSRVVDAVALAELRRVVDDLGAELSRSR